MITAEIKEMPTRDRIILREEIWDTLCDDENEMESPLWHEDVLDERRTKIIINPNKSLQPLPQAARLKKGVGVRLTFGMFHKLN